MLASQDSEYIFSVWLLVRTDNFSLLSLREISIQFLCNCQIQEVVHKWGVLRLKHVNNAHFTDRAILMRHCVSAGPLRQSRSISNSTVICASTTTPKRTRSRPVEASAGPSGAEQCRGPERVAGWQKVPGRGRFWAGEDRLGGGSGLEGGVRPALATQVES